MGSCEMWKRGKRKMWKFLSATAFQSRSPNKKCERKDLPEEFAEPNKDFSGSFRWMARGGRGRARVSQSSGSSQFCLSSTSPAAMFFTSGALLSFFLLLCLALIHETQEATSSYIDYQALNKTEIINYNSQSTDIGVGSNLSTNAAASWLSSSGRFSFGFYSQGKGLFLVGIKLIINSTASMVVWTARLDLKPFSKYATLIFTADGFLLNPNSVGDPPFFLFNFSSSASSAAMLDNGNFIVFSSNSSAISQTSAVSLNEGKNTSANPPSCSTKGSSYSRCRQGNPYDRDCSRFTFCRASSNSTNIIWRSFDYPTDTILGSQFLPCGHNLTSSAARNNNPSIEAHVLSMQCDGNLVIYPVNSSAAIWASVTSGYYYRSLVLDENGHLYLQNDLGSPKDLSGYNPQNVKADMIYAAKLDADNIFRLYAVNLDTNTSTEVNDIPYYKNKCYDPEICGVNSFCLVVNDAPKCQCAPGFTYIQASAERAGCQRSGVLPRCNTTGGAVTVSMEKVEHVVGLDELAYLVVFAATDDDCSSKCLDDCDCYATVFREKQCSKLKMPLSGGRIDTGDDTGGVAFVKLGVEAGSSHTGSNKTKREVRVVAIIVTALVSGIICLAVIASCGGAYWLLFGRFREQWEKWELAFSEEIAPRYFNYNELLCGPATSRSELGKGAHGTVFKVKLPMGGISVAVKMLHGTENDAEKDFRTEMSLIGRARHANLVRLLGFCHDGPSRLLVYEYMCRNSLAKCIFEGQRDRHGWARRVGLLLGAARGIHYLHRECETKIIHRDIKPENILISEDWTAKISDFGLAKFVFASQTNAATRTVAVGTNGYIAPECQRGDETSGTVMFTEKADVYSYGVVILETVCSNRRKRSDGSDLCDLARKCYDAGEIWMLVGSELVVASELGRIVKMGNEEVKESEIERVVKIGILCVQEAPLARPSMEDVVMMLEGDLDVPNLPPVASPEKGVSL
ncbi:G-type lectin S-receptor-like serine/threonine-protein kinase RLK1 [Platanthera zijinensis]|uniref:non-specific serine/threonine protein kinase n=1 Tax=Platanthera zijinensis TaxID=2320716 RepID=A0AAP0BUT7_9ASPA